MLFKQFLFIFIGGGIGSVLRFGIGQFLSGIQQQTGFPWGTFSVNIIGSFLIGFFIASSLRSDQDWNLIKSFLIIGFCGGFTTFSSFAYENFHLLREGHFGLFALYAISSLIIGLSAVYLGWSIQES
jgi:CrcB protein